MDERKGPELSTFFSTSRHSIPSTKNVPWNRASAAAPPAKSRHQHGMGLVVLDTLPSGQEKSGNEAKPAPDHSGHGSG